MWLKGSDGQPSVTLTLSVIAFAACLVKFMLNGVSIGTFSFGTTDSGLIMAMLTTTLGSYTVKKFAPQTTSQPSTTKDSQ